MIESTEPRAFSKETPRRWTAIADAGHPGYLERVYAGVLGKLIGVYLGRPVETWPYERIVQEFGTIEYYIHEARGRRLIVTDDDISGTFTFLRALQDNDYDPNLTAEQIGQTWLNYLIERTTILWWGGMGNSTEHTAYLRLKHGVPAPKSGSMELNTKIMAEQIGAQIFIDGWGMICPGDPTKAAEFARRAASVSHDGEAIYGAQVIAALVAEAFVEIDLDRLLDRAVSLIPPDCTVRKLIDDIRQWHAMDRDWRANRERLVERYGYDKYLGNCHLIPNHGIIILSLLHGEGDFDRSLSIVNTCGWDTDCNSGNLGAILGVRNGLEGLSGKNWRAPVADQLFLPSMDGGRSITDAARETIEVANAGRALAGFQPLAPKNGARFHFSLPGSVQSWRSEEALVENHSGRLQIKPLAWPARVATPTFIPPDAKDMKTGYVLVANPTIYPGQTLTAELVGGPERSSGRLFLSTYGPEDSAVLLDGPLWTVEPEGAAAFEWQIPDVGGYPILEVGLQIDRGSVELDFLTWDGIPTAEFPAVEGTMWARAWAKGIDRFEFVRDQYEMLSQNEGIGLLTQGCREWEDYRIEARLTPKMAVSAGFAIRVQGLRRYYSLTFADPGEIRLEKVLDGRRVLATTSFMWEPFHDYHVELEARGNELRAWIDGKLKISAVDLERPLVSGAFGFIVEAGCLGAGTPRISPA
ncbi:MAG TPA: ADP-ribosylglycohydrolase family protein [Fimbriimonas sp.]|nr:ADP-ribosylglycohydrolase family protein [Fimbriimonas sp.]